MQSDTHPPLISDFGSPPMPGSPIRRWHRLTPAIPLTLMAIALAVRLHGLSDKPLWLDEIITQRRANLAISDLIANSLSHRHFPTYFLLIRPFDAPVIDEWLLRLPSAIFGSVSVLLVALIATEVRSLRAGVVAASLMALSPLQVQFSQEARSYALVSCLVLLALWGLVRIAHQASSEVSSPNRQCPQVGPWLAFTTGTIGALNTLLLAALWLITSNLAAVAIFQHAGPKRREFLRRWALTQAIIVLTWIPGLLALGLAVHGDPFHGFRWIPPTTPDHAWSVFSAVYLLRGSSVVTFELLPTYVTSFGVVIVILALMGVWRLKSSPILLAIMGLAAIAIPIAIFIISIFHPILVPRYLLLSAGPFFILVGIGVTNLPYRLSLLVTAAMMAFGIASLAVYYRSETKPRWDLAAAYLAANVRSGDSVIANDDMARYVLAAYGDRYHLDRKMLSVDQQTPDAEMQYAQGGSIWVVYGRAGQGLIGPENTYLTKWLALGSRTCRRQFGLHVVVLRIE
jgi:mannosyltransferase